MAIEKDLIDVNEFRKLFWTKLKDLKYIGPFDVDYIILNTPKVDAVEVAHGRWEEADDGDGAVCSVCREDFCNIYLEVERFLYCPNCGAKMDGGNNSE